MNIYIYIIYAYIYLLVLSTYLCLFSLNICNLKCVVDIHITYNYIHVYICILCLVGKGLRGAPGEGEGGGYQATTREYVMAA